MFGSTYATGYSNNPELYITAGLKLYKNYKKLPLIPEGNQGARVIGSYKSINGKTSEKIYADEFIVKSFEGIEVANLTLEDLNIARESSTDSTTSPMNKDAASKLFNISNYVLASANQNGYYYFSGWIYNDKLNNNGYLGRGLRPVISIPYVKMNQNSDNIWQISQ